MHRLRRVVVLWQRASFTFKFATVILLAGGLIAVVPLLLAQANTRGQAEDRAADKAGIARNLIQEQRTSLSAFTADVARQLNGNHLIDASPVLRSTLVADLGVNDPGDVLGVIGAEGITLAVHDGKPMAARDPLLSNLIAAVQVRADTASNAGDMPWLLADTTMQPSGAIVFAARPLTNDFVLAIDHNLVTSADPADLAIVDGTHYAVNGSMAGENVTAGDSVPGDVTSALSSQTAAVIDVPSGDVAVASAPLGGSYLLVVSTPVQAVTASWQPLVLLLALILVSMCVIVIVVQTSLQRPLRRLDRAVAALGRGQFDVPLPTTSDDELRRLSTTFEAMRRQIQATIQASSARAAIATELSATQPLETALAKVCAELRRSLTVDSALIVIGGSEMNDAFAIVDGVREEAMESTLSGDGPLGEGFRHEGVGSLMVCAAPASRESRLGVREFLVAPLRIGNRVHGVVAVARREGGFLPTDSDLVAGAAEQLALALERYRILAVAQRQASIDDLTGLYNHRFFVDYLGQQVALAERLGAPLAVLMLDIDHFKALNDAHGHQAGDAALAAFAQTVTGSVRRSDLAARYGGEEFAVIMANTTAEEARLVAEKVRLALAGTRIQIAGQQPIAITVSIGGAAFPEDTDNAGELLSLADEALYRAKRMGRDRTCMATDGRHRTATRRAPAKVVHTAPAMESAEDGVGAGGRRRSAK